MKVAPAIGHDCAPGSSVRMTLKPGVPSQSAFAAAAWNADASGTTGLPSRLISLVNVSLFCLA
jgi:hypothetical protein